MSEENIESIIKRETIKQEIKPVNRSSFTIHGIPVTVTYAKRERKLVKCFTLKPVADVSVDIANGMACFSSSYKIPDKADKHNKKADKAVSSIYSLIDKAVVSYSNLRHFHNLGEIVRKFNEEGTENVLNQFRDNVAKDNKEKLVNDFTDALLLTLIYSTGLIGLSKEGLLSYNRGHTKNLLSNVYNVGVDEFETNFELTSRNKENRVRVNDLGNSYLYEAKTKGVWFDGSDIRGGAKLTKYDLLSKHKKVWSVSTESDYKYFCSKGNLTTSYDCSAHYRADLNSQLVNRGIKISHKLFDILFEPIDKHVYRMYKILKGK